MIEGRDPTREFWLVLSLNMSHSKYTLPFLKRKMYFDPYTLTLDNIRNLMVLRTYTRMNKLLELTLIAVYLIF